MGVAIALGKQIDTFGNLPDNFINTSITEYLSIMIMISAVVSPYFDIACETCREPPPTRAHGVRRRLIITDAGPLVLRITLGMEAPGRTRDRSSSASRRKAVMKLTSESIVRCERQNAIITRNADEL